MRDACALPVDCWRRTPRRGRGRGAGQVPAVREGELLGCARLREAGCSAMASHPLLARMREAGMVGARRASNSPTSSVDFQIPTVELEPEDSVSQITSSSPSKRSASGGSPKKRAQSRGNSSKKLAGLAAPNSNVRMTQSVDEEPLGQTGWGKLRKVVKKQTKQTKKAPKVPVRDLVSHCPRC